jgi:hypothetical protein
MADEISDMDELAAILFAMTGTTAGPEDDAEPFDNAGVVVEADDGTTMTYEEWEASGGPETGPGDEQTDDSAILPIDIPDLSGWADHRRATIGVLGMTQGIGEE